MDESNLEIAGADTILNAEVSGISDLLSITENTNVRLIYQRRYKEKDEEVFLLKSTVDYALILLGKKQGGIFIENENYSQEDISKLSLEILQGLGLRFSKAEFIACPSCGRTKFNLFDSFEKVKSHTSHLNELRIAVMGCIVNGPGEMGDADYGYVGAGPGKVTIYKKGEPVFKNVDETSAVKTLVDLIKDSGDWSDPE
jgi:(E)-4-hydroxy-3-methylbut-2-enyl-diphosphate synthase